MKKKLLLLATLITFTVCIYAQQGDLTVGARGAYITNYKDFLFGLRTGYHLTDPLEVNFSFLMSPEIKLEDPSDALNDSKVKMYTFDLNLCYYIIMNRTWGMGPALGGEYGIVDNHFYNVRNPYTENDNYWAFNVGWQLKYNITENIKLDGGWKYSAATQDMTHHTFYLGVGYTFNLF